MIMTTALMCLAIAINNEARGEPLQGKFAVGHVILNRTNEEFMGATDICETVYMKGWIRKKHRWSYQFSYITSAKYPNKESINVAQELLMSCTYNPIGSKLYFHENSLGKHKRSIIIGHHTFY